MSSAWARRPAISRASRPGNSPTSSPKEGGVGYLAYFGRDIEVTAAANGRHHLRRRQRGHLVPIAVSPHARPSFRQFQPEVRRRLDDLAGYLPEVKAGLEAAVQYGTARLAYDPAMQIYGKTGTCSEDGAHLGWFVSYAQEQQPNLRVMWPWSCCAAGA